MLLRRIQLRASLSRNSRNFLKPAPHTLKVLRLDSSVGRADDSASRDENDVDRELTLRSLSAKDFPQEPLRAIPLDRAPDLPARDETDPQPAFFRDENEGHEEGAHPPSTFAIHALEVRAAAQAGRSVPRPVGLASRQTERRCRPLRRRLASTALPAFERILTRKPWVRLRRRRFGWNVLFISS